MSVRNQRLLAVWIVIGAALIFGVLAARDGSVPSEADVAAEVTSTATSAAAEVGDESSAGADDTTTTTEAPITTTTEATTSRLFAAGWHCNRGFSGRGQGR